MDQHLRTIVDRNITFIRELLLDGAFGAGGGDRSQDAGDSIVGKGQSDQVDGRRNHRPRVYRGMVAALAQSGLARRRLNTDSHGRSRYKVG